MTMMKYDTKPGCYTLYSITPSVPSLSTLSLEYRALLANAKSGGRSYILRDPIVSTTVVCTPDRPLLSYDTEWFDRALVYTSNDSAPFICQLGYLSSMCGGIVMRVIDCENDTPDTITEEGSDDSDSNSLVGYTDDDVSGLLGQILVVFSKATTTARRGEFLEYIATTFADAGGKVAKDDYDVEHYPSTTTFKWLTNDIVGLFTEYNEVYYDHELYTTDSLDGIVSPTGYEAMEARDMAKLTSKRDYTISNVLDVHIYFSIDFRSTSKRLTRKAIIHAYMRSTFIPAAKRTIAAGRAICITSNEYRSDHDSVRTRDILGWLTTHKKALANWGLGMSEFLASNNPNEGSHYITGLILHDKDTAPSVDAPLDNYVVRY